MKLETYLSSKARQSLKKLPLERARTKYKVWRQRSRQSKTYLAIMFAMCSGECPFCERAMVLRFDNYQGDDLATFDHEVPLSEDPVHDKLNLVIMCKSCNNEKSNAK